MYCAKFLPTFANHRYLLGALVLKEHPTLSAAIGKCIGIWSNVDHEMGMLFGLLFGTNSEASLEVFLTLRRAGNQIESLKAAAKFKLASDDSAMETFNALINTYRTLEAERNQLAHGCFGISEDDPTLLLCIAVKHNVHFNTDILIRLSSGAVPADPHLKLKENLWVYQSSDLQLLYEHMENFWWAIFNFNGYLREPSNKVLLDSARKYGIDSVQV